MERARLGYLVAAAAVSLVCAGTVGGAAAASSPDLDPEFGGGEIVTTDFGGTGDAATGVEVQPDGRIVVVGGRNAGPDFDRDDYALARYTTSGGLDGTFGDGGRVVTDFGGPREEALDVAVDAVGRIVAAGWAHPSGPGDFAVARYLPSGALDTTFGGGDGLVTIDLGGDDFAADVELDAAGRIVLAGGTAVLAAVVRLLPSGGLDPSFDGDGKLLVDLGQGEGSVARGLALDADGRIVLGGGRCPDLCSDVAAARVTPGGSLDPSFGGGDGVVHVDLGGQLEAANAVDVAADGDVVLAGYSDTAGALVRLDAAGALDGAFGNGGKLRVSYGPGSTPRFEDVAVLSGGRVLVAGSAWTPPTGATRGDLIVARFLPDGTRDATFSGDGLAVADAGSAHQYAADMALQPDGRIVVAGGHVGQGSEATALDFALARFRADGASVPPGGGGGGGAGGGAAVPPGADLELTKTASAATVEVGQLFDYRITVRLKESSPAASATRVVVSDVMPPGIALVSIRADGRAGCPSTAAAVTCDLGVLLRGEVRVVELRARAAAAGLHVNSAAVTAAEADPDPSNNGADAAVEARAAPRAPRLEHRPAARRLPVAVVRRARKASVETRLWVSEAARITVRLRDPGTGRMLVLLPQTRVAGTVSSRRSTTARARASGLFTVRLVLPSARLTRGRPYQLLVTAVGATGRPVDVTIRFRG